MWEKTCNHCNRTKPNAEFERRGNGYRNTCKLCRRKARNGIPRPRRPAPRPVEVMPAEVNNSFALWFGPVDRCRTIRPTL